MDAPGRLTSLPSWLTSQVAQQGDRLVSAALGEAGVRKHHFTVLTALAEHGATSQAELGRRLWLDRSDLHAVLNDLERDGLVARVRDEHDRRRNVVEVTPAGTEELVRWDARVEAAQDALLEPLSVRERRELAALLERIVAHHRG
jgi:MarR family transcriptional regulator, lower aerobic nicotinate degradation pathway regulator